ncbi:MAG TPA: 1-acyl-sn-glycerol-3-phosphate acyltransferase [Planctomycetota bacterium]|nr:1-acyl-sn-glycerol-3-phosphate acyltransferase [Planctomycetota bacterium]
MRTPERTIRLGVFFTGFFAWIAWSGFEVLGVRLLSLASPRLASRLMRRMAVRWNRLVAGWARLAAGVSIDLEGEVPEGRNLIFIANHQSIIDITVLLSKLGSKNLLFVAKEQMRRGIPNISPCARHCGYAFISRKKGDAAQLAEIERLGARLERERASGVIFAEGTRSRDGLLGKFKAGGVEALLRSAPTARVVPVAIDGTWRAASFAALFRHFAGMRVRVRVGPPIEVAAGARRDREAVEALADRCRAFCASALASWRGVPEAAIMAPGGKSHEQRAPREAGRDPRDERVRAV